MGYIFETEELIQKQEGASAFLGKQSNRSFAKIIYRCEQCLEDKTLFKVVNGSTLYLFCLQCGSLFVLQRNTHGKSNKISYRMKSYKGKGMFVVFKDNQYYFTPLVMPHKYLKNVLREIENDFNTEEKFNYISRMLHPRVNINRNIYYTVGDKKRARYLLNYLILLSIKDKIKIIKYIYYLYTCTTDEIQKYEQIAKTTYMAMKRYPGLEYEKVKKIRTALIEKGFFT